MTVTSVDEAIARMRAIAAELPPSDGVACFNRMYLDVTLAVQAKITGGFFADANFMAHLDVTFANLYFDAVDALPGPIQNVPTAWRPLVSARGNAGIEAIQFALAGMNAHINHDLPIAVVQTCRELHTQPGPHHDDYTIVDRLLDGAEQSIRESFEPTDVADMDRHVASVMNLVCNWSMNTARDVAWDTGLALWEIRGSGLATGMMTAALARLVATASQALLVAV
jgi:hypothetical protein